MKMIFVLLGLSLSFFLSAQEEDNKELLKKLKATKVTLDFSGTPLVEFQELLKKLKATKVTLDFSGTPLVEVLDFLSTISGIEIVLDETVLTTKDEEELLMDLALSDLSLWHTLLLIAELKGLNIQIGSKKVVLGRKESTGAVELKTDFTEEEEIKIDFLEVTDLLKTANISSLVLIWLIQEKTGFEHWSDPKTYLKPIQIRVEVTKEGTVSQSFQDQLQISQTPEMLETTHLTLERFSFMLERGGKLNIPETITCLDTTLANTKMTLQFSETSIEEILNFLREITNINIVVSAGAQGFLAEKTISFSAENISAREALTQILNEGSDSLCYTYRYDGVYIEKKEFDVIRTREKSK